MGSRFHRTNGWEVASTAVDPIVVAIFVAVVTAVVAAVLVPVIWFFIVAASENDGD